MSYIERLLRIEQEAKRECSHVQRREDLEGLRSKYLGRKGIFTAALSDIPSLEKSLRAEAGREANRIKSELQRCFEERAGSLERPEGNGASLSPGDLTLPGTARLPGLLHPLTQVTDAICDIFLKLGFRIASGPEMETDYYNFEALNIPLDHPSRESFDTFLLDNGKLLRSQTSTVQIHVMEHQKPPIKVIAPGRVFRPDATDASHSFMFHQIEGLMVGEKISLAQLKGVLLEFARQFFGRDVLLRFRPHFFPFTEPSAEVDCSCVFCKGSGCRVCAGKGWLEILGAGMVHPNVLECVKLSSEKYTGFAFGMGIERIAMLKWGITDIRLFFENDICFLKGFA